ncbi:MAG: vanadium-dependent haloperoxidase [Blastocatellia bacterium]|nr:vanadium-dependent haloperoxidase [Blastocatellia bacterium]
MKPTDSLERNGKTEAPEELPPSPARRKFLGTMTTAAVAAGTIGLQPLLGSKSTEAQAQFQGVPPGYARRLRAAQIRHQAASIVGNTALLPHPNNGDETSLPNRIGSYSKGLPHNNLGEVNAAAYATLLNAVTKGRPVDFANITIGLGNKLVNPQSGLAFEMEGADPHALVIPPAPAFSSAEEAGEIAEDYWMALLRDVNFLDYDTNPLAMAAAADLSAMSNFKGPKSGGLVTTGTLFRGLTPGDLVGPYISQFLWQDTPYGSEFVERRMRTRTAGVDYMTDYTEWLAIQNGFVPGEGTYDPTRRYIRNGRDMSEWVHVDVLFQAYFNAFLILNNIGAPVDQGNPYNTSANQIGFGTFGGPYMASVLCAVARPALKAQWYQKWFVHRRLRPEVFAGRIHNDMIGAANYPIHSDILNSPVLDEVFDANGTYLLPMAFPEGSPTHPAYGAGHSTVAGACVTALKAFFDESFVIPNPVQASADGLTLEPFAGPALTVGGELNKLASNISIGRDIAGVHWRSDGTESLKLGEAVAIAVLRDEKLCFNEQFAGYSLTKFDGTTVTI